MRSSEDQRVIDRFIINGRLVQMPSKRSKMLLVLDVLAQEFELGRTYAETEVNDILRTFHDDVAALRRYLVDDAFLSREDGHYWRTGGTVDLESL